MNSGHGICKMHNNFNSNCTHKSEASIGKSTNAVLEERAASQHVLALGVEAMVAALTGLQCRAQ